MLERGFTVDHSTVHRWMIHYSPQLEQKFRQKKRKPCGRWRVDETYIKVKGSWKYYYRAVDKYRETIDFLLTAKRDTKAALRALSQESDRLKWEAESDQYRQKWPTMPLSDNTMQRNRHG